MVPRTRPFDRHLDEYENWFVRNRLAYLAELEAIRRHIPEGARGLEIGVGSGLFAAPLGIREGVEPSRTMREKARSRDIQVLAGVGEDLPFPDGTFDFTLMVTTICFLDNVGLGFLEARRVVKSGGRMIVGFVDRESPLGKLYLSHQEESLFYREATFFSASEVLSLMERVGLMDIRATQTLFAPLEEEGEGEEVREGHGQGSFVVLSGKV